MKEDRLIYLLESLLGKSKNARGGDEAVFSCPNCNHHKKKLTFNKYTQKFQCWVCGFKGARAIQLLKFIKAPSNAFQELKDIDADEKRELQKIASEKFDLRNDNIEFIIEEAVSILLSAGYLVKRCIELKKQMSS